MTSEPTPAPVNVEAMLRKELDSDGYAIVASLRNVRSDQEALAALEAEAVRRLRAWLGTAVYATVDDIPVARLTDEFVTEFAGRPVRRVTVELV